MSKGRGKSVREDRTAATLIDSIGDGIVLLHQGNIAFANAGLLRMLGYSRDEIEGTQFSGLLTSRSAEVVSERDKRVMSGEDGPAVFELDILRRDGGMLPVEAKAARVDYEGMSSDLLTMRDISERQSQEEELREAARRYKAIFDTPGQMVYLNDERGRFLDASDVALKRLGYTREELGELSFQDIVHPEDIPGALETILKAMETGYVGDPVEVRVFTKSGEVFWIESSGFSLQESDEPYRGLGVARDITDRKQAEQKTEEIERRYRAIFDNPLTMVYVIDEQGRFVDANDAALKRMGITRDALGKVAIQDVIDPEDLHKAMENLAEAMSKGYIGDAVQFRLVSTSGERIWIETAGYAVEQDGEHFRGLGIARDITDRKMAEEALQGSERYFKALIENSSDAIYVVGADGTIKYESPSVEHLFGHVQGENIGVDPFSFIHPEDERDAKNFYSSVMENPGVPMSMEYRFRAEDGMYIYIKSVAQNLIDDPAVGGIVVNARDVTERREAEETIRDSEARFRTIFNNANDSIIWVDREGEVVDANARVEVLFGYSRDELVMSDLVRHDLIMPAEMGRIAQLFSEALEGRVTSLLEVQLWHKDGRVLTVEVSVSPVEDVGGVGGFLAIVRDITERKETEELVAHYAAELARSNADLEQFAYVASHDLQEPLRMVSSYVKLLEKRYKGRLDSDADEFIYYAVDGVTRMQALIEGLLAVSRVGTRGKEFGPVECEAVLDRVLANLQMAVEDSGAVVTHDSLPKVMADELQLSQVFQNLIANAIKFRKEESPRIHVSAEGREGEWVFSVRDNGIGFEQEYAERIFVIFQRLHRDEEYDGTGIGLALCEKIVERHGGSIWVESHPGAGSTFYFSVPFGKSE